MQSLLLLLPKNLQLQTSSLPPERKLYGLAVTKCQVCCCTERLTCQRLFFLQFPLRRQDLPSSFVEDSEPGQAFQPIVQYDWLRRTVKVLLLFRRFQVPLSLPHIF